MSVVGQTETSRRVRVGSSPNDRHVPDGTGMPVGGQKRSFKDFIGGRKQVRRHGDVECFGGFHIDDEVELRGL